MVNKYVKFINIAVAGIGMLVFITACKTMQNKNSIAQASNPTLLSKGFILPLDSIKPFVYWYWVSDNISKDGITKDLEAMAKVGIGEAFIGNIGLESVPYGKVKVLSDEWWQLTRFAIKEGQRLGVNIGMFNSPGWSQSGGPWVKPTEAMRYMVTSETIIDGGKKINSSWPSQNVTVQQLAVIAFPAPQEAEQTIADEKPTIQIFPACKNADFLFDKDLSTAVNFTENVKEQGLTIEINLKGNFTARSLVLFPDTIPCSAQVELQAFNNGTYLSIKKFLMDRSNPMITVGPMLYGPVSVALPATVSNKFRLLFTNISTPQNQQQTGGIKEIVLSNTPKLESYIEKQMGKMLQTPDLVWSQYLWPSQTPSDFNNNNVKADEVINVSKYVDATGVLNWQAPAGKWVIRWIGLQPTGAKNTPASPEATGFEVDKMNRDYLKKHFDAYIGKILKDMLPEERKSLKHVVLDSYEVGPQNWTEGLAEDFKNVYGYDPIKWLPVLSGTIVNSANESDRFLWDLRRLVADRIAVDYVGGLKDLSEKQGLRVWLENYGHWGFPSEFLKYGGQTNDIAGEFWVEGTLGNVECRAASSAAHIYGNNRVFAESYTAGGMPYQRYPGYLKKRGDWSFTEGINHVLLHLYIHQPYEDKNPGMNAWFGTEFNRKNTWFNQAKTWIDYQRRCMYMLQQGKPVNDVCYFIGEDAPKLAGARNPEIPVGYSYDYINADVIMNRLSVADGKLMLPDGMSYSLMVLPPLETITPELLKKIKTLIQAGAVVLGPKPTRSPSLKNFPFADKEVAMMANELWGTANSATTLPRSIGKGWLLQSMSLEEALRQLKIVKDIGLPEGSPLLFTHRKTATDDIYFITNQSDEKLDVNVGFRIKDRQPKLWNAINGSIRKLPEYEAKENGTNVPLHFEPAESFFIVFSNEETNKNEGKNFPLMKIVMEIKNPWTVKFEASKRGPVKNISFDILQDWALHTNDSIKYYSGTAWYKNSFNGLKAGKNKRLLLDLGAVKNMATIKINGQLAGGLFTAPWQIDITDFVNEQNNLIEVEVVNLWVNRMIGDSKLPVDKRPTWLANNYFNATDPLQPSGLLGPVTIKLVQY